MRSAAGAFALLDVSSATYGPYASSATGLVVVIEGESGSLDPELGFRSRFAAGPPGPAAALTRNRCSTPAPRDSADPPLLPWQRPRAGAAAHPGPVTAAPARSRSRRNARPG